MFDRLECTQIMNSILVYTHFDQVRSGLYNKRKEICVFVKNYRDYQFLYHLSFPGSPDFSIHIFSIKSVIQKLQLRKLSLSKPLETTHSKRRELLETTWGKHRDPPKTAKIPTRDPPATA